MLISANQLSIHSGDKPILKKIDLQISNPAWIELTGKSCSGKTSFLNALYGYHTDIHGHLEVLSYKMNSISSEGKSALRRKIGYCFQTPWLLEDKTVRANAALAWRAADLIKNEEADERISILGRKLQMENKLKKAVGQLSYTEKHLAALIQATVHRPPLILLDQIFDAFDSPSVLKIIEFLDEIQSTDKACIIITTKELNRLLPGNRTILQCDHETIVPFGS